MGLHGGIQLSWIVAGGSCGVQADASPLGQQGRVPCQEVAACGEEYEATTVFEIGN